MEYIWDLIINNFIGALLVFFRVSGIFTFNPVFGRQNVPMQARVALSLVLSLVMLASMGGDVAYRPESVIGFTTVVLLEMLVGFVFGFITNMILTVLLYAGELIDNQIGLSMAKSLDPSTGIQMPVFANFMNHLFVLYFFVTGGHLLYIQLFALSYDILPIGYAISEKTIVLGYNIVMFLGTVLVLAAKLAFPVVAAELITEFCIGVIMKAVPTIQIFVVNIQLKIVVGLLIMVAVAVPISDFIDRLMEIMWKNLESALYSFS